MHRRKSVKAYVYQIGEGSGDEMKKVIFAQEMLADSLGKAIDKAKAMTRTRTAHDNENTIHILDEEQAAEFQVVWARSAEDIRNG